MSGNQLPPPSPFDAPSGPPTPSPWAPEASPAEPAAPALPTLPAAQPVAPSPWARPADGEQPVELDVRPNPGAEAPAPSGRAAGKVIGIVAVIAMVIAGAVLFALRGRGGTDEVATGAQTVNGDVPATTVARPTASDPTASGAPDEYSWEALASQPHGPQRLVMSMSAMGEAAYEIVVETDDDQRMHMTMDGVGEPFEMVVDVPGGEAYLTGFGLDGLTTAEASWVQVDLESVIELTGMDYQQFLDSFDLAAEVQPFEGIGEPESQGLTEIDGETLMLYTLTVDADDLADLAEAEPGLMDNPMIGELADGMSAEYRIYVTEDSHLRRLDMVMDMFGEEMTASMTATPIEPGFEVALPDPADVEEIDLSQLGQLG